MKKDPSHQILEFTENEELLFIAPHKRKQDKSLGTTLWHEQIEIKLFYSAGDEVLIGNQLYITEPGNIYVINSCEPHSSPKTQDSTDYHMLIIDIAKIPTLPNSSVFQTISAVCKGELLFNNRIKKSEYLQKLIEELVENHENNKGIFDLKSFGLLLLILNELVEKESVKWKPEISRKNIINYTKKLSPAIELINNKYTEKIPLSVLADACGLNEKYFCKVFRLLTGTTAIEYINNLRINKAEVLISTTDMSLLEIAEKCGFAELSYFSKKFKDIKGYTPTTARKNKGY
ncbi:MAG: helix-turn-helix domain-containing protein [Ruminococcaceae bacterium]|nr:helix-turn-helix domain-containing protein [Oscillospiraceae bacterium]